MMSVYRSSPMVPMSVILLICLISLSEANATSSFPSSLITDSTLATSQSWRNATTSTSASNSQPTEHVQGGSITGPGYYLTRETSSYIETKTLNSGVSETVTLLDGSVTVEVGLAVFTDLNVETYVQANLYSTQSKSFYPWDPSQLSGLWNVPESYRTGPPSLLSLWSSYTSYARQSACREDFSQFVATQPVTSITTLADLYYKNPTTVGDLDTPGYTREIQTNAYLEHCCGNCEFVYRSVQLFYWPAEHPNTDCYRTAGSAASTTSAPTQLRLRGFSENSSITSAPNGLVVATDEDGFTYTSPSLYIKFPTLSAGDRCGALGVEDATSATLSFAPGELSTLVGWCPSHGCTTSLEPFDPASMPCGPPEPYGHYGPGGPGNYSPLFAPITKLKDLRPEWWNCTAGVGWNGWDPPRTLEPATAMVAPVTSADPANKQTTPAAPSPTTPPLPSNTGATADPAIVTSKAADMSAPIPDQTPAHVGTDPIPSPKPAEDPAHSVNPNGAPQKPPQATPAQSRESADPASEAANPGPSRPPQSTPEQNNQPSPDNKNSWPPQDPPKSDTGSPNPAPEISNLNLGSPPKATAATAANPGNDPGNGGPASVVASPAPGDPPQPGVSVVAGPEPPASDPVNPSWGNSPQSAPVPSQNIPQANPMTFGGFTFCAVLSVVEQGHSDGPINPGPTPTQGADPASAPSANAMTAAQPSPWQASGLMIGGTTLLPGGPASSVSGTPISLASSHIVIGTNSIPLPSSPPSPADSADTAPQPPAIFTLAGQTYTPNPTGFSIGSTTLLPGNPAISISGTPISLASSHIIIGTSTIPLPSPPPWSPGPANNAPEPPPTFTLAGQTYTLNPTGFPIGDTTLLPNAPAITISGTPISHVIIGTNTIPLPTPLQTFIFASQTYTLNPTGFPIGDTTLLPNAPAITISNTPISLAPSALIIGSSTLPFQASYITLGSDTLALGASDIVVGGTTLTPGAPAVTAANGDAVSLGSSMLIVGTRTETFAPPTQTAATSGAATSMNIGDMIMSGLGGMGGGTVSTSPETGSAASSPSSLVSGGSETSAVPFTGAGRRQREFGDSWLGGGGLGIVIGVVASL